MDAFHAIWTKPGANHKPGFSIPDAQLLTMVVSALSWRYYNGKIRLYTDAGAQDFLHQQGLEWVWSEPVNTTLLDNIPHSVHPETYWAAAKLFVMGQLQAPAAWLDTDLIITRELQTDSYPVTALHPEGLDPAVYPPPETLPMAKDYCLPDWFNNKVQASNTAFLAITDETMRELYCNQAFRFMQNNPAPENYGNLRQMVFAEQRMLAACAHRRGIVINYLLEEPFSSDNNSSIHLWGFKRELANNPDAVQWYIHKLIYHFRFLTEPYPEFGHFLQRFI